MSHKVNRVRLLFTSLFQACSLLPAQCDAADVECPWEGTSGTKPSHTSFCPYVKLYPLLKALHTSIQGLEGSVGLLTEKVRAMKVVRQEIRARRKQEEEKEAEEKAERQLKTKKEREEEQTTLAEERANGAESTGMTGISPRYSL